MTTEQINALQPGPECDKAVQEIVRSPIVQFHPSRNWPDAMQAAELFGLFDYSKCGMSLGKHRTVEGTDAWQVYDAEEFYMRGEGFNLFDAPTGQLAICRAILALS